MSKTKVVVRSHVWWPMMDNDIVATIQEYLICQEQQRSSRPIPVMLWPFLDRPWSRLRVYLNYAGPNKDLFFILADTFSKRIEVFLVSTPSAETTIACLLVMLASQGLPDKWASIRKRHVCNIFEESSETPPPHRGTRERLPVLRYSP